MEKNSASLNFAHLKNTCHNCMLPNFRPVQVSGPKKLMSARECAAKKYYPETEDYDIPNNAYYDFN